MSNKKNLIPQQHKLTVEEQSRGGKKSVASRKRKKYLKEVLEELLQMDLADEVLKNKIRSIGIEEENLTIQSGILCSLVQQALLGNLKAYQLIRDQIGQNPKEDVVEPLQNIYFVNDISAKLEEKKKEK